MGNLWLSWDGVSLLLSIEVYGLQDPVPHRLLQYDLTQWPNLVGYKIGVNSIQGWGKSPELKSVWVERVFEGRDERGERGMEEVHLIRTKV